MPLRARSSRASSRARPLRRRRRSTCRAARRRTRRLLLRRWAQRARGTRRSPGRSTRGPTARAPA
eukprot:9139619-Alexandrium_andersonii.AAC.1